MELDALIFMVCAWGATLGLLSFCVITLFRNPQSAKHPFESKKDVRD